MKNKKFLTLVLALVMVLGSFGSVFAATTTETETKVETVKVDKVTGADNKVQWLIDNKFVEGRKVNENPENNDLALDKNIKRAEITKLLVYAIGRQDLAEKVQGTMKAYSDVEATYWANGVITVGTTMASPANNVAFLNGYPDRSFKPENDVTYAELAKMLVVLVKKDLTQAMHDEANKNNWPAQWMTWAAQLGILEDVTIADSNAPAVRKDAFIMMYNALYAMEYIKKMPANETTGILSQLKNNELTLNQGDKAKTIKITNDTNFILYNQGNTLDVNADKKTSVENVFTKAIKVSAINNPSYYYGSLMRVLTNEKGEATHILELGNPRFLAMGHEDTNKWEHTIKTDWQIDPNQRWRDIADGTVETSKLEEFKNENEKKAVLAKLNYKDGAAKQLDFWTGTLTTPVENKTNPEIDENNFKVVDGDVRISLNLTNKTKYYVADVLNNQLTEVDNVEQALVILGNTRAANWFYDVYAGYETVGGRNAIEHSTNTTLDGYHEATVVVFNSVQKGNNATKLLRVKNETSSKYDITFEDTDGKEVMENLAYYRDSFPYNFSNTNDSAKLDVIEFSTNNAFGQAAIQKIDHSNTDRYPIAKVTDVQNGGRTLILEGEHGETASIMLVTDFDKFVTADKNLVGRYIQFHTLTDNKLGEDVNKNNHVDIISVLPENNTQTWSVKGSLKGVLQANEKLQHAGRVAASDIVRVDNDGNYRVMIYDYYGLYNTSNGSANIQFDVTMTEAEALKAWLIDNGHAGSGDRVDVRFKADKYENKSNPHAWDFQVLIGEDWKLVREVVAEAKAEAKAQLADTIDGAVLAKKGIPTDTDGNNVEVGTKWVTEEVMETLENAIDVARTIKDNPNATRAELEAAKTELTQAIATFEAAKADGLKLVTA